MALNDNDLLDAIENRRNAIFTEKNLIDSDELLGQSQDKDWLLGSITRGVVSEDTFARVDITNRFYSSAQNKFEDSTLGGNTYINPLPQFTQYADPRVLGKFPGRQPVTLFSGSDSDSAQHGLVSDGLGHYYNEAFEDNAQVIHMRFGSPEFNSLTNFFTSFYNENAARVARTGRIDDIFFRLGNFAGTVVNVLYWPLLAAHAIGAGLTWLMSKPASKFYYLRPTMTTYWLAVNTMVNQIQVNKGLYATALEKAEGQKINTAFKLDKSAMANMAKMMPDIFSANGGVDVYAVGNRGSRIKREMEKKLAQTVESSDSFEGFVQKYRQTSIENTRPVRGIADSIADWASVNVGKLEGKEKKDVEQSLRVNNEGGSNEAPSDWLSFLTSEWDDGAAFASFRVNHTGSVGESFTNTATTSDLASKINSTSAQNKAAYFTFAGGNVTDAIGSITGAASSFAKGVLNSFGASGLVALAGSAFVDIPKHYENSSAKLASSTYTIHLISPTNNPISQIMNIDIPLCMLLTAALPKAAGKQSYTWPYLVELYDKSRAQTRLGMIDSLSVTRGTTNLPFSKDGNVLGVEVTFTVMDMSEVMSMPVSLGFSLNPKEGVFDDETVYSDYMAILSGLNVNQQIYKFSKLKLAAQQRLRRWQMTFTPSYAAGIITDLPGIRHIDLLFRGTDK